MPPHGVRRGAFPRPIYPLSAQSGFAVDGTLFAREGEALALELAFQDVHGAPTVIEPQRMFTAFVWRTANRQIVAQREGHVSSDIDGDYVWFDTITGADLSDIAALEPKRGLQIALVEHVDGGFSPHAIRGMNIAASPAPSEPEETPEAGPPGRRYLVKEVPGTSPLRTRLVNVERGAPGASFPRELFAFGYIDEPSVAAALAAPVTPDRLIPAAISASWALNRVRYASPSGAGDGRSVEAPMGLRAALDELQQIAPLFPGTFTINVAEGVYTETWSNFRSDTWKASQLNVAGPARVNGALSAIFRGQNVNGSRTSEFIRGSGGGRVQFTRIRFETFTRAVRIGRYAFITLNDCDCKDCAGMLTLGTGGSSGGTGGTWDCSDFDGVTIPDSIGFGAAAGANLFDFNQGSYGAGSLVIKNCDRAIVIAECSCGHTDYITVDNCRVGMELSRGAGSPNNNPMRIWRCDIGILNRTLVSLLGSKTGLDFGIGTANATTRPIITCWNPGNMVDDNTYDSRPIYQPRTVRQTGTFTGSTSEIVYWHPGGVPNMWHRNGDTINISMSGTFPSANADPVIVRLRARNVTRGELELAQITLPPGSANFDIRGEIIVREGLTLYGNLYVDLISSGPDGIVQTRARHITSMDVFAPGYDTEFYVTVQLTNPADSIFRRYGILRASVPWDYSVAP